MERVTRAFEIDVPEELKLLSEAFKVANFDLYLVGGAVRDAIMGSNPKDFDVATNARPEDVIDILQTMSGWTLDEVGRSFGVVRARMNDQEFEIATFRKDIGEGRRPDSVEFTTIENDVSRRDLTVNALFYDLNKHEVVDLVGGLKDIKLGIVRTVGNPVDRFREDRLRVLRAIRFAARFSWIIDGETRAAITVDSNLDGVSPERIRDELVKGIKGPHAGIFMHMILSTFSMSHRVFPGLVIDTCAPIFTKSVPVLLASIARLNDVASVSRILNELKYTSTEIAQTIFLMEFTYMTIESAFRLKKRAKQCHINDDLIREFASLVNMHKSLVRSFLMFEPTVSGELVLSEGFFGKDCGLEIERRETALFKRLFSEIYFERSDAKAS